MVSDKYNHILVATDGLKTSDAVHETAFNLAREHGAMVTLVCTARKPGFASKLLSSNANDVFEMVVADKQERLERCAKKFEAAGIEADSKVLVGKSSEAIAKEANESNADLVIRYRKGAMSKFSGRFGNTARALIRYCPVPVLFVGDKSIDLPKVLACVDVTHETLENASVLGNAARMGRDFGRLEALYCWHFYQAELMEKKSNAKAFREAKAFSKHVHEGAFTKFQQKYDVSNFSDVRIEEGFPQSVIPKRCETENIDVVVMCSATLNHPLKRYFGSTVESVIERLSCSVLVVKPEGFVSPVLQPAEKVTAAR